MARILALTLSALPLALGAPLALAARAAADVAPRPLAAEFAPPPLAPAEATPAAGTATPELSLSQALERAFAASPELSAAGYEVEARGADAAQANRFLNPGLVFQAEDFGGSRSRDGDDQLQTTVLLSQPLEIGGQRGRRRRVAELSRTLAQWDRETLRLDVATEVSQRFIALLAAQARRDVTDDWVELSIETVDAVGHLVWIDQASPIDLRRARIAMDESRLERTRQDHDVASSRRALAASWGHPEGDFEHAVGDLAALPEAPALPDLLARMESAPELARLADERAYGKARHALARTGRVPLVEVGAGVRHYNDDDSVAAVVELSLGLPLFDRNSDATRAEALRSESRQWRTRAAARRARTELARAWEALAAAREEARVLDRELVPEAETTYRATLKAYVADEGAGIVDVLDTQQAWFEFRLRRVDALERLHAARAVLERRVAAPLR